jgi:predicted GTPase
MFREWQAKLRELPTDRLNYFEQNLEVWRQLWRVLERSDVLLLLLDARYPLFHFPLALYNHVAKELGKPVVIVLNKVLVACAGSADVFFSAVQKDLVEEGVVKLWEDWFAKE